MKIKALILTLALVLGLQGFAYAQTTDAKLHQFYPSDYNTWTAVATNSVAATAATAILSPPTTRITARGGQSFNPFRANSTVLINNGGTDVETVTISSVSCSPPVNCSITATFGTAHTSRFNVQSGTYGLQEALDAAVEGGGGGVVWVEPTYPGTTAMITSLVRGSATVPVIDRRNGVWNVYVWSGSAYAANYVNGQTPSGATVQILTKTTTINGSAAATISASNFIPAGALVLGVTSYVTSTFSNTSLTSMKIGDGTTTDKFSSATMALVAGTTSNGNTDGAAATAPRLYQAATSIVITGNGANFAANGTIRIVMFYIMVTPPTA